MDKCLSEVISTSLGHVAAEQNIFISWRSFYPSAH